MIDNIAQAIRQRDLPSVVTLMFEADTPSLRAGFRTETELWDFKSDCPKLGSQWDNAWADVAKEVLGFHNEKGGVLIFGIKDTDFSFCGATTRLDSKLFNDHIRKFLGDKIWVDYTREFIHSDQRYIGIALVPPRGPILAKFHSDAPEVNGKQLFKRGDSAIRERDSTRIIKRGKVASAARELEVPRVGKAFAVDDDYFRILAPEYAQFVNRKGPCEQIVEALQDPRATVASVIGIGGVGKTALATWSALRAYEQNDFEFIVSMTAKDRELTSFGIQAIDPGVTSFEALLDNVLDVLGLPETKRENIRKKEDAVRSLLENSNGLLYVDNLETVDDVRIVELLDNLPVGVRALITSRRTAVRVSVRPVEVGPLTNEEIGEYVGTLSSLAGFGYVESLSMPDRVGIGRACDGVPIAIRWVLARSQSSAEALARATEVASVGGGGEELLEFCFRRVFESMNVAEKSVINVLSLFQRPIPSEAIMIGAGLAHYRMLDATEDLIADGIVQRLFDSEHNDYSYTLLPVVRAFVYSEVSKDRPVEQKIRGKLSDYFEARDVRDPGDRLVVREIRQGKREPESALLDMARSAEWRGDIQGAEGLYSQALQRNPTSWKAAKITAEFYRHKLQNLNEALRLYEQAAAHAPRRGPERARIFREWGILTRDSGSPDATDSAIEKLTEAHAEAPDDVVAISVLAQLMDRKGAYKRVIELVEPIKDSQKPESRRFTLPLLLKAYERLGEIVKAVELRPIVEQIDREA